MGVALTYASSNRQGTGLAAVHLHLLRRSTILFGIGLCFGLVRGIEHVRVMGVLQRIALVYLAASLIALHFKPRAQALWAVGLCAGYALLMLLVPVPGHGAGDLSKEGNLAAYIDTLLLSGHLHKPGWDPEGLLHTLPAISTALAGVLCGHWVRSDRPLQTKVAWLGGAGGVLTLAGLAMDPFFPINKNLWSPSFVLLTAGLSAASLGLVLWLVDGVGVRRWTPPFLWHGQNPLAIYVASTALIVLLLKAPFTTLEVDGARWTVPMWISRQWIAPLTGLYAASFAYSVLFVGLWTGVAWALHRRRIVIKL
jgi:predicted acyltransferase